MIFDYEKRKEFEPAIHLLVKAGYRILAIDGDLFAIQSFDDAGDNHSSKHNVKGRLINNVIEGLGSSVQSAVVQGTSIQHNIEKLQVENRQYHQKESWVLYISIV